MQRPGNNIMWRIVLAFVCTGILGYGLFYSKNTTADLAYLTGRNLPLTLIIWGVFYAAVARKRGAKIAAFSFLTILVCMIASDLIGYSRQKQEVKQMLSEIQKQYSEIIKSSTDSQGLPKRVEKPINTTPKSHGEFGEIERFIKELMNKVVSQRNNYLLELKAIGWNSILDANRIKADKTFAESKIIIQKAKEIVQKYKNQTNKLLSNARENIRSLNISESLKRKMLLGFDRGMKKAKKNIDAMWLLEGKIINEVENIITLLSARKGTWVVNGEQILFYNDSDLEKFNSYIISIQNMEKQEEEIRHQNIQTINRELNRMKKMMK